MAPSGNPDPPTACQLFSEPCGYRGDGDHWMGGPQRSKPAPLTSLDLDLLDKGAALRKPDVNDPANMTHSFRPSPCPCTILSILVTAPSKPCPNDTAAGAPAGAAWAPAADMT
eukprot:CAMPEP_0173095742 /NCGR_PEP_ID=MMETSP1102-20130122/32255_1 /TAXON_ID=49646 /ORGANISM="Geminigera sp., Strain Caron Lab Isolate" /LENGTH=112 /DNA_ID=CAMNT_0013985983 /DNA_START=103 /DNA_END=441 /DNA_ORIENTATION=+